MARTRAKWPKKFTDERRFRFRVRFTRPPGDGIWDTGPLSKWLTERLGGNGWALYPDDWDGHGADTYAVHLDDHTAIPDLLSLWEGQKLKLYAKPVFRARLGPNVTSAIRGAIRELQSCLVDELNANGPRVTWTMGTCALLPGGLSESILEHQRLRRIRLLGEVDALLGVIPAAGEPLTTMIEDEQRGAVEIGVAMLQDLRPVPAETIECLRLLLDALEEVRA